MTAPISSVKGSAEWLRATLLSALGVVPLGVVPLGVAHLSACTGGTPNSNAASPQPGLSSPPVIAEELTLRVTDDSLLPEAAEDDNDEPQQLHGYRFCDSHTRLKEAPGWFQCDSGMKHRAKAKACPSKLPRAHPASAPRDGEDSECLSDADCDEQPHGHCGYDPSSGLALSCLYGCIVDADCAADQVCLCDSPVGYCMPSGCRTDADCGGRALCAVYDRMVASSTESEIGISCQNLAQDRCGGGRDCGSEEMCVHAQDPGTFPGMVPSEFSELNARVCISSEMPEGRPFLINGDARTAHAVARNDWSGASHSDSTESCALVPESRRDLHAAWLHRALQEHASIAAFSRFSLQLLALGAPPNLLEQTQRATLDEIAHAQACFAQASRFAGHDVGPGSLDISGVSLDTHLFQVLEGTLKEGCVGETLAALEAAEAAHYARDPAVKATLQRIAADEARHAALAWRFVAWALEGADAETRTFVTRLLGELVSAALQPSEALQSRTTLPTLIPSILTDHGVLPEAYRHALSAQGLREVIAPCARVLLESSLGLGITLSASSVVASRGPVTLPVTASPA